ncbi:glycosyltransferase family 9 protein [bacterium]|nr:glycosyltransferase family 9 protein [bacterium]
MKVILIQTAWLGDNILSTPLVQNLARIGSVDILTLPKWTEIYANNPFVQNIRPFDKHGKDKGFLGIRKISKKLCSRKYDAAVIPQKWWRSAIIAKLAGIPERIGFDDAPAKYLYTKTVPYLSEKHDVLRLCELVRPFGIVPEIFHPVIYPSEKHISTAQNILGNFDRKKLIALAPGSAWATKIYTKYPQLANELVAMGYTLLCIGSNNDIPLCNNVLHKSDRLILAGLSILETAAILKKVSVLIANDSGSGHLASAVGTPVISIFGPTVPAQGFYPYGESNRIIEIPLECRPCNAHGPNKCPLIHHKCMNDIPIGKIIDAVKQIET